MSAATRRRRYLRQRHNDDLVRQRWRRHADDVSLLSSRKCWDGHVMTMSYHRRRNVVIVSDDRTFQTLTRRWPRRVVSMDDVPLTMSLLWRHRHWDNNGVTSSSSTTASPGLRSRRYGDVVLMSSLSRVSTTTSTQGWYRRGDVITLSSLMRCQTRHGRRLWTASYATQRRVMNDADASTM